MVRVAAARLYKFKQVNEEKVSKQKNDLLEENKK